MFDKDEVDIEILDVTKGKFTFYMNEYEINDIRTKKDFQSYTFSNYKMYIVCCCEIL